MFRLCNKLKTSLKGVSCFVLFIPKLGYFISDNDNDSHYHYDNHSQKDSMLMRIIINMITVIIINSIWYAPTFIFFNFGMNCAIASSVPRKLFLYQLLQMRMISIIKYLLLLIMRIVIRMSINIEFTIFFIAHATATPPVPRYIHE